MTEMGNLPQVVSREEWLAARTELPYTRRAALVGLGTSAFNSPPIWDFASRQSRAA